MNTKVYEMVTTRILTLLAQGTVPWHQPWTDGGPRNLVSRKPYRGVNVLLLTTAGYDTPYWLTLRQANALSGRIRRGEQGTQVVLWKPCAVSAHHEDTPEDEPHTVLLLRCYTVFNWEQTMDIPLPPAPPGPDEPMVVRCEQVLWAMPHPPEIRYGASWACSMPTTDLLQMPSRHSFQVPEAFFSTLYHELTHSTGHPSRLNRHGLEGLAPFGTPCYAREELVAEMGAACALYSQRDRK